MGDCTREEPGCCEPPPPRRAFIASAAIGLTGFVAGLTGCTREDRPIPVDEGLESLRKIDPKLVKYRETHRYETGLQEARGIASDVAGTLYAVGDREIRLLGGMGGSWPVEGEPSCLAVGEGGVMYVGMGDHVAVLDRTGKSIAAWPALGSSANITAIAVHNQEVWVADSGGREITRHRPDGQVAARFGKKDPASGYPGLIVPSPHLDLAVMKDGRLICSNPGMHRLELHDAGGALLSSWGEATSTLDGFCGCCNPTDFTLFPDGRYVTAEKGIPRVKVYSKEGKFVSVVAGPDAFPSSTMSLDIAVSPDNKHVYVLEPKERVVRVYSPAEEGKAA